MELYNFYWSLNLQALPSKPLNGVWLPASQVAGLFFVFPKSHTKIPPPPKKNSSIILVKPTTEESKPVPVIEIQCTNNNQWLLYLFNLFIKFNPASFALPATCQLINNRLSLACSSFHSLFFCFYVVSFALLLVPLFLGQRLPDV